MRRGSLAAAAACCAVLALAACGSTKSAQRHAVDAYFRRVDAVEQSYKNGLTRAQRALDAFGKRPGAFHTESYARAAATLAHLRASVAAVDAPPPARPVRRDVLRLLAGQAALARELGALDTYLHATRASLDALRRAENALRTQLAAARTARTQRLLFAGFADDVNSIERRFAHVPAPPALAQWHDAEEGRMRGLRGSAAGLAAALARRDTAALRRGLDVLRGELAGRGSVAAERAAIRAYDRRAKAMSALAARVDRERAALARRLGT